jgi:hypothetical protein
MESSSCKATYLRDIYNNISTRDKLTGASNIYVFYLKICRKIFNYLRDYFGTNHGAEEMRLDLSVLQLYCVNSGLSLYVPLVVKRCA